MLRAAILLVTVLVSLGLAYTFGPWVLAALLALSLAVVLFSTQSIPLEPEDAGRAGAETAGDCATTVAAQLHS